MNPVVTIGGLAYNFVIILICTIVIVIRRKNRGDEVEDFLSGGRRTGWMATAASMALGVLGGGHINGVPVQTWADGVATIFYCLGTGCFFIFTMRFTGIWYRRAGVDTINDLFAKMLNPAFSPILAGLVVGYAWLVMCVETQSMGVVISNLTGLSMPTACLLGSLLGVLYVLLAGQEEIALVNLINAILMYVFGIICLIFIGTQIKGGWREINDTILSSNPEFLAVLGNGEILRTYTIGTFLAAALGMNFLQGNVQPCKDSKNVKQLRQACYAAIPMNVCFGMIMVLFGFAGKGLVDSGRLVAADGASSVVQLVLVYMPSWLQICVIGMFLAAMLSTWSMLSLSIALTVNRDILVHLPKKMSKKTENWTARLWIVIAGLFAAICGLACQGQANLALSWGWGWFIPLFILFAIGMWWKRSRNGSLIAVILCWIVNTLVTFTPLAAKFNLEGNNFSIFMFVFSLIFGFLFTALDKNAKPSFRKTYEAQRAEYDAKRASRKTIKEA